MQLLGQNPVKSGSGTAQEKMSGDMDHWAEVRDMCAPPVCLDSISTACSLWLVGCWSLPAASPSSAASQLARCMLLHLGVASNSVTGCLQHTHVGSPAQPWSDQRSCGLQDFSVVQQTPSASQHWHGYGSLATRGHSVPAVCSVGTRTAGLQLNMLQLAEALARVMQNTLRCSTQGQKQTVLS